MRSNLCKLLRSAGCAMAIVLAQTSHSAVLLSDNFDADSPVSVLNFNGFINWTVDSGTVDYIRSGSFGITCVGAVGGCVDSDGSTSNAGRLLSKAVFSSSLAPEFDFLLDISGNQRGGSADVVTFGAVDATTLTVLAAAICPRNPSSPFSPCGLLWSPGSSVNFRAFIEGAGGDNIGAVFDNFRLTAEIAQAPEPATLALLGIALAGLGFSRRKRAN